MNDGRREKIALAFLVLGVGCISIVYGNYTAHDRESVITTGIALAVLALAYLFFELLAWIANQVDLDIYIRERYKLETLGARLSDLEIQVEERPSVTRQEFRRFTLGLCLALFVIWLWGVRLWKRQNT